MNKISLIIPTYNRLDTIKRTIAYLEKTTDKPDEIIVVDQSNKDNYASQIKRLCDDSTLNIIYQHEKRPSSTMARNVGITLSKNEILVFMDDDVDVKHDTFTVVRNFFNNEHMALLGALNDKGGGRKVIRIQL